MSVSSASSAPTASALPHWSDDAAAYSAPLSQGPVLVLSNKRAFRNPKPYLQKVEGATTLRCEGVPAEVPAGVQAIGRLPGMEQVRSVEWSWKGPLEGDEHLLMNFLEAPAFSNLDTLWLDGAPTTDGGVQRRSGRFLAQLAKADRLPSCHFHIDALNIDIHAIRTMRAWEGFGSLLSWRLTQTEGGRRWGRFLSTLPADNQLRYLEISHSDLGDEGLSALLEQPLPHLERLVLQAVGLTDKAAEQLLAWDGLEQLQWLDLSGNNLSTDIGKRLKARLGEGLRQG